MSVQLVTACAFNHPASTDPATFVPARAGGAPWTPSTVTELLTPPNRDFCLHHLSALSLPCGSLAGTCNFPGFL